MNFALADEHSVSETIEQPLKPGARVEIIDGAMAGYKAVVSRLQGRERIAPLLDIAGRHVALLTSSASVQRV